MKPNRIADTQYVRNEIDRQRVLAMVANRPLGYIVKFDDDINVKRSNAQNRLQQLWHQEAACQLCDESTEDKRAYCKLHFGVPMLRHEDEEFCEKYDRIIMPMTYEAKLDLMKVPFDFPVTRLMDKKQKTRFLDMVWNHYTSLGVVLTFPADLQDLRKEILQRSAA